MTAEVCSSLLDWLAARDARVRREGEADGLRAAADEIRETSCNGPGVLTCDWLRDRADRITP